MPPKKAADSPAASRNNPPSKKKPAPASKGPESKKTSASSSSQSNSNSSQQSKAKTGSKGGTKADPKAAAKKVGASNSKDAKASKTGTDSSPNKSKNKDQSSEGQAKAEQENQEATPHVKGGEGEAKAEDKPPKESKDSENKADNKGDEKEEKEEKVAVMKADAPGSKESLLNPHDGPKVITGKIFMQASIDSDIKALKTYLIARGPLPGDVLNHSNNSQMNALMMATQKKTDFEACDVLKLLLSSLTPMAPAVRLKKCIQIPLKKGDKAPEALVEGMVSPLCGCPAGPAGTLNLNMQNRDGYTALHFAARKGFSGALLLLLSTLQ